MAQLRSGHCKEQLINIEQITVKMKSAQVAKWSLKHYNIGFRARQRYQKDKESMENGDDDVSLGAMTKQPACPGVRE